MTGDDIASARKLAAGGLLIFVLWLLAGRMYSFAEQVKRQDRQQKQTLEMFEQVNQRELANIQQHRNSHPKMPASAVVNRLRQVNAFGLVANPERRLHCTDNQGDWDYVCLFQRDPVASAPWFEFGVIVDNAHIIQTSPIYPSGGPLPAPLSAPTR